MTEAQIAALSWLSVRNGDGLFDRSGVLVAGGERAPFTRQTWNTLQWLGMVEIYRPPACRTNRVRLTTMGAMHAVS